MGDHLNVRVRFYPGERWTCVVQRLGADGMPLGSDLVSATGEGKEGARQAAIEAVSDEAVRTVLREAR